MVGRRTHQVWWGWAAEGQPYKEMELLLQAGRLGSEEGDQKYHQPVKIGQGTQCFQAGNPALPGPLSE